MNVKIDTKEKFLEIKPLEASLSANMAEDLDQLLTDLLNQPVKNVILDLDQVESADIVIAQILAKHQQRFYEHQHSFVMCSMQAGVEKSFEEADLLDFINATPTLSEAWDIVQMEEIERELLDGME